VQFAFSVSKKIYPNAPDRNRVKRLMRESIRLLKPEFYSALREKKIQLSVLLSYQSKTIEDFKVVYDSISSLLKKLTELNG
jgi:ribonuclease P protein component